MIHQYQLGGYNIVVDVYSGSVHAVDPLAYDAIAMIDAGDTREQAAEKLAARYAGHPEVTAADIRDVLDDIDELTAAGTPVSPPMPTSRLGLRLQKAAPPWSRRSACMWPTPAT